MLYFDYVSRNQSLKDTEYRCHFSLGEIKLSEGRPAEALQCFERARKVAQHQKKKFDEADTLVQMGQVISQQEVSCSVHMLTTFKCQSPIKNLTC